ncbi:MAG TPA: ABC transporter permease [Acetobacteraceae bacterium]|nr:ABC transporter permease [Acetobacteraceae bacterium]
MRRSDAALRAPMLAPTWAWLFAFVAAPAALLAVLALAVAADGVPPFALAISPDNLATAVSDPYYLAGFLASLRVASISAAFCLLIGYPLALAIARTSARWRPVLLLLVMLPFWTGFLLRIAAWIGLLRDDGWINAALMALRLTDTPLHLLYTDGAMYAGIVYAYLPFLVLPLVARLTRLDPALEQAAADLGASPWAVFRRVTLPLSLPGVWAGLALVFVPVTGEYVIPELLGGPQSQTLGRIIWDEFFANHDWPLASALALLLLVLLLAPALAIRNRAA